MIWDICEALIKGDWWICVVLVNAVYLEITLSLSSYWILTLCDQYPSLCVKQSEALYASLFDITKNVTTCRLCIWSLVRITLYYSLSWYFLKDCGKTQLYRQIRWEWDCNGEVNKLDGYQMFERVLIGLSGVCKCTKLSVFVFWIEDNGNWRRRWKEMRLVRNSGWHSNLLVLIYRSCQLSGFAMVLEQDQICHTMEGPLWIEWRSSWRK